MTRRGIALLLVVGVLGILGVLATTFVTLARLERRASLQRLHATKALLLARSGVEDALARISAGQDPEADSARYRGEDFNGDGVLNPSSEEAQSEVYRPGVLDTATCPVRQAVRPSFFRRAGTDPRTLPVGGRLRGYSGLLGGEQHTWSLRMEAGGIHVNGGLGTGYAQELRRMLGTLAEALGQEGQGVAQTDGFALLDARPASGWASFSQLRDLALGGSQAKLEALRPYLALHTWEDARVIRPNATVAMAAAGFTSWGNLKTGALTLPLQENAQAPTRTAPSLEARAPVSLAWARHRRPALIALLAGLKGLYLDETTSRVIDENKFTPEIEWNDRVGTLRPVEVVLDWSLASDECRMVADQILVSTAEIRSWAEWNVFCDGLTGLTGTTDLVQAKKDLLKANFNPNSDLNKFNPNRSTWKSVDKMDLLVHSTEFALDPVQPLACSCVGRLLGTGGRLLAQRQLSATLAGPCVVRISTQREFACESLGDLEQYGDETGVRKPGYRAAGAPDFMTQSNFIGRTWGHRMAALGQYPGTWLDGDSLGLGLQSYPEPCVKTPLLTFNPADYDGNLQLATVETETNGLYEVTLTSAVADMKCLARFDDGFDLDVADGTAAVQPDLGLVTGAELANSVLPPVGTALASLPKLNTLHPDGCYSERDRAPVYLSLNNMHAYHGVISFWVKRNYDVWKGSRTGHMFLKAPHYKIGDSGGAAGDQIFYIGDGKASSLGYGALSGKQLVFLFYEMGRDPIDDRNEQTLGVVPSGASHATAPPHRWSLVTTQWDLTAPDLAAVGEVLVDSGAVPLEADVSQYDGLAPDPTLSQGLTDPDRYGAHRMVLGMSGGGPWWAADLDKGPLICAAMYSTAADATLDEFASYDFGGHTLVSGMAIPPGPGTLTASNVLASNRYPEGRYYKGWKWNAVGAPPLDGESGAYFTAPFALPAGSLLKRISWTFLRPQELPDEYAEVEVVNAAGTAYLWGVSQSRSSQGTGWTPDKPDWILNRVPSTPFRLKIGFSRVTPLGGADALDESNVLDTPLLDSPVLDDLTVLYLPPGGARVLSWSAEE